ncbi:hypothetical protein [Novosphingobium sp. CCH12-A3]|uniref:hypothetical protein n=1 Tax=Novosphingobium sp. CCH12-A3 TaxID=1768752 RepID=UPI003512289F
MPERAQANEAEAAHFHDAPQSDRNRREDHRRHPAIGWELANDTSPPGNVSGLTKQHAPSLGGFTRFNICASFFPGMFQASFSASAQGGNDMAALLHAIAEASLRPRYAFMVLTLIAEAADSDGKAGPFVRRGNHHYSLRDWLSDSLTPMGARDPRRLALAERVRDELQRQGKLARDSAEAALLLEQEVRDRIRISTKTNLSRAVSELVRAGLVRRHYAGFRVDHQNRGGHRHVVYTLAGQARCLLHPAPAKPQRLERQSEFVFN